MIEKYLIALEVNSVMHKSEVQSSHKKVCHAKAKSGSKFGEKHNFPFRRRKTGILIEQIFSIDLIAWNIVSYLQLQDIKTMALVCR